MTDVQQKPRQRIPPQNLDAERALLGALMYSRQALTDTAGLIRPEDFYKPAHGHIHNAIRTLDARAEPVDTVTVAGQLAADGLLDLAGGLQTLTSLVAEVPAARSAPRYATLVTNTARLRTLIAICGEAAEMAYTSGDDPAPIVDWMQQAVYQLTDTTTRPTVETAETAVARTLETLEHLYQTGGDIVGVPTGLIDLDLKLTGLRPGQLITAGGRPGMGKSAFTAGVATHAALTGTHTLFVTIEMTVEELVLRMFSSEGRVDHQRLRTGRLVEKDWPRIGDAASTLSAAPLWFLDAATATLSTIRAEVRRLASQVPLGLVVVDYLQLLLPDTKSGDRRVDVDELCAGLKRLAREFNVPVVAAVQLSRSPELRADKRPILADFRESGAIEANSDVAIGLYRDEVYHPDTRDRGVAELVILKQRNGPTGTIRVAWLDHYTRFSNMARTGV